MKELRNKAAGAGEKGVWKKRALIIDFLKILKISQWGLAEGEITFSHDGSEL